MSKEAKQDIAGSEPNNSRRQTNGKQITSPNYIYPEHNKLLKKKGNIQEMERKEYIQRRIQGNLQNLQL